MERLEGVSRTCGTRDRAAWQVALIALALFTVASSGGSSQSPTGTTSAQPGPGQASPSRASADQAGSDQIGFWCPMHPNIRGHAGEKCGLCGMALVHAVAGDYHPYGLDFEIIPRALRAHQKGRVRFHARDPHTNAVVRRFELVHERLFHLFVLSRDFEYFAHIHPTLGADGSLDVEIELPRPGVYQLIADFVPTGGLPQLIQKSFVTTGYAGSLIETPHLARDIADKVVGDTRVKLTMPEPIAGREQLVSFELQDTNTGAPVTDLEPYLGAAGHLLLASADLAVASHSHPVLEISEAGGPTVVFQWLFPRPGDYRMWVQFQRHGRVVTARFTVPVNAK